VIVLATGDRRDVAGGTNGLSIDALSMGLSPEQKTLVVLSGA
jgi:hypothetical protein